MQNRKLASLALVAAVLVGGCEKQLTVQNPNSGDTERVLGTPNDAENLIGTYWKRWMSGLYGSITNPEAIANMYSMQTYSSLANECQGNHTPLAGSFNDNQPGHGCAAQNRRTYVYMSEVNRVAASFLTKMDEGLSLGSPARDSRARAWAYHLNGLALGYMALWYDSGAVISPGMDAADAGVLSGYKAIAESAYVYLQKSIDETNKVTTGDQGFPLPNAWMPSPTSWTKAEFIKLTRSYRARLRANVARTPAERAAADWAAIIADAQNGITADHIITTSTTVGPGLSWRQQYETFGTWHQMPPFFIGMADVSGSYASWIATPMGQRGGGGFFMQTPDLRFPQGADRTAQRADFAITSCQTASTPCKRYFANRAGTDQFVGFGYGWSQYDFVRFHSWNISGDGTARNGNTPIMTLPEMDMLQAEGMFRAGNFAGAAGLVNKTRVRAGLPAITDFNATSPMPGGNASCVPRVPVAPFNVVACGTLWDAIKYEKRIETAFVHQGVWYFEGRGWGDLAEGTPLFWPTPFEDLQARGVPVSAIYGTGAGPGNAPNSTAPKGVYGW